MCSIGGGSLLFVTLTLHAGGGPLRVRPDKVHSIVQLSTGSRVYAGNAEFVVAESAQEIEQRLIEARPDVLGVRLSVEAVLRDEQGCTVAVEPSGITRVRLSEDVAIDVVPGGTPLMFEHPHVSAAGGLPVDFFVNMLAAARHVVEARRQLEFSVELGYGNTFKLTRGEHVVLQPTHGEEWTHTAQQLLELLQASPRPPEQSVLIAFPRTT